MTLGATLTTILKTAFALNGILETLLACRDRPGGQRPPSSSS